VINFHTLTFKNILSVGNTPVTLELDSEKTTLIHGTNGTGKSTVLDALCYSLFGKPFRRINLPQLINTQNKKGLVCEVTFSIGSTEFMVKRGMKPNLFEIWRDGEQVEAKASTKDNQVFLEQNILKLSFKSFTQVVILGSAGFVPFMQLPSAGRRECVEDFLDIKVFSTMSVIAKERLRALREALNGTKGDVGNSEYKIDLQEQRVSELEQQGRANLKELEDKIADNKDLATKQQSEIISLAEEEEDLIKVAKGFLTGDPAKKINEFTKVIGKLGNKIERLNKNIAFYEDNTVCHACHQDIQPETKDKYINSSAEEVETYTKAIADAQELMSQQQESLTSAKELQKQVQNIQNDIFKRQTLIETYQKVITECENKITESQMDRGSVERELGKLDIMKEDLASLKKRYDDQMTQVNEYELVVGMLKDSGIKTQIVKKYLPVMNKCIRKYLTALELPLHFVLDEEFNESVSSPLHQNFSYASFSEGQKARIDLALLLTWREVCRLKNSVSVNLLLLDEVFSGSLDETGKELLLHILRYELGDNTNVLVVDHTLSGTFRDKFDRQIEVTRPAGFSKYN
jgi:DNA repair exonuclease SbcCD ATPase subunit